MEEYGPLMGNPDGKAKKENHPSSCSVPKTTMCRDVFFWQLSGSIPEHDLQLKLVFTIPVVFDQWEWLYQDFHWEIYTQCCCFQNTEQSMFHSVIYCLCTCINYYWKMVLLHGPRWAYAHEWVGMAAILKKQNGYHMYFITFLFIKYCSSAFFGQ